MDGCSKPIRELDSLIQYDEYGFERYIANYSKGLTPAQKKYSPIELEAYTIILALDKFYKYFVGRKIRIEKDARSLTHIFNQVAGEKVSKRIWRWVYILMQLDFRVVHIKGTENVVSDWMSKNSVDIEALYKYLDEIESKEQYQEMDRTLKNQKRDGELSKNHLQHITRDSGGIQQYQGVLG